MRLSLVGTGTDSDPFRLPVPTYRVLDVDYAGRVAIVDVPDGDIPPAVRGVLAARGVVAVSDPPAPALPTGLRRAWQQHLDERYREHAGEFRPDLG